MGTILKLFQVPLDGIPSFGCIDCTTEFGVICKLAEGTFDPTVYVIDKDMKQHRSQDGPLRDTSLHQPPPGHRALDTKSRMSRAKGECLERWEVRVTTLLLCQLEGVSVL